MKRKREVWFQRAMIGGWHPIHWKGYVLLFGVLAAIFTNAGAAVIISQRHGPKFIVAVLVCIAGICWAAGWVISLLHSRPWRDRNL